MDIFGGLLATGSVISDKLCNVKQSHTKEKIKSSQEGNMYNSNIIPNTRKQLQRMADDRNERSKHTTKKGGVVSKYYNLEKPPDCDSTFSDGGSNVSTCTTGENNASPDPMFMLGDELRNNKKHIDKFMNTSPPSDSFVNQFAPLSYDTPKAPSAANKVSKSSLNPVKLEIEREMCLNGGYSQCCNKLSYGIVPDSQLTHNNMVPYFSPRHGYGDSIDDHQHIYDMNQRKVELFTGNLNNLDYRPKTERKPLFNPMVGLTNIYGMPVLTDAMEGRGHVSRERRNEKPFQEVKVTPGLNLGYNEVGKQGYHDMYRAFDPNIDQLRAANHQQVSHTLPLIYGMKGHMQPLIPKVPKRRPVTFEEWGTKRMLPSLTEIQAPMSQGYYDPSNMATVNRGLEERVTYGPEQFTNVLSTPENLIPKVQVSSNENFEYDGPHAIGQNQIGQSYALDHVNATPDPTMRSIHAEYDRAGQGMGSVQYKHGYVYNTLNDVPDPTMRSIHPSFDRAGQGVGQSQFDKGYLFDNANAIQDPNMRTIHNEYDRVGQGMGQNQYNRSYAVDMLNSTPDPTMRDIHDEFDRVGSAIDFSSFHFGYVYDDKNAVPDPNMRTVHPSQDRAAQGMGNSQFDQSYVFDGFNATPDPNMRVIHPSQDRAAQGMGNSQFDQSYVFDSVNATPDPNMRTVHSLYDRAGQGMGNGQFDQTYAFDSANATPDPNMRTIHSEYDRAGQGMGQNQFDKGYAFDSANATPDPNMRTIHNEYDRAGFVGNGQYEHAPAFDMYTNVPDPTMRTIHDQFDRAGQGLGQNQYDKGHAFDMYSNIPDPTMREVHIQNTYQGPVGYHEKEKLREDAESMYQNINKEVVSGGRAPTTCNVSKGPCFNGTLVELCTNVKINRDLFPDIQQQITPRIGTIGTRIPLKVPNDEWHFNEHPILNLQNNPYINNTQHVSVTN